LQWFPSNHHIHPLQSAYGFHLLETLCHVPFLFLGFAPLVVSLMAMSYVVSPTFTPLVVSHVEMSYVVLL
jgi:hypothetical protein